MDLLTIFLIFLLIFLLAPTVRLIKTLLATVNNNDPIDLKTKYGDWAVVTGATDGVGKEYAKELAKRNVNVVLISRTLEKLNKTKDEIQAINQNLQIKVIQADFSKVKEEMSKIESELNDIPVGILVNNVGRITEYPMYLGEITPDELQDTININISAATLMTRMVIEKMKERKKGAIVNISSMTDLMPTPLMAVYGASKIYIKYFSDAIRVEYSKHGLTVQCLSPCYINTRMVGYSERIQSYKIMCPDARTYAISAIKTLGKLDSTTGYWVHDVLEYISLLLPMCIRTKMCYIANSRGRNDYFKLIKK